MWSVTFLNLVQLLPLYTAVLAMPLDAPRPITLRYNASTVFTNIVAFGDSFLDNGNGSFRITNRTWPSNPAYYDGRFSNGRTWIELFADDLKIPLHNYAIGGSTSSNSIVQGYTGSRNDIAIPSADEQARAFLAVSHSTTDYNDTLFAILAGGNDIFFNPDVSGLRSAAAIFDIVAELQSAGAKHFLLPNYPDLSQIPYSAFVDDVVVKEKLASWSSAQAVAIQGLCETLLSCTSVDLADLFRHFYFYGEPDTYGFDAFGAYGSCLVGAYGETANVTICDNPDKRVFWDEFHPSAHTHQLIAEFALTKIDESYKCNASMEKVKC